MTTQRDMLITTRDQFAMYAQSHRAKASRWQADLRHLDKSNAEQEKEYHSISESIADTIRKAEVNEQMVRDIQAVLDEPVSDVLMATAMFPAVVYDEGITPKNQQTQLGVHFEEVAELIDSLRGTDTLTIEYLGYTEGTLKRLATHLKDSDAGCIVIHDRLGFLDAMCDQLVTATVGAVLYGMDPVGGLREVNRSNYSKLTEGRMEKAPITQKWVKGPNYVQPDLTPFINLSLI